MFYLASLGGVLHLIVGFAGGVLSGIAHHIHTLGDTPIFTSH